MTQKFSDALERPIGIYYEHPEWFRPLFQQLDERGVNWTKIDIRDHSIGWARGKRRIRWCSTA